MYGFVLGDPVNFADPFGDSVRVKGSAEFNRYVEWLKDNDPEFRSDYSTLDADDSVFLILEDPLSQSGRAIGGRSGGAPTIDYTGQVAALARQFRIPNLKGVLRIGSANRHEPWWCTLKHEAIHFRGLVGSGQTQTLYEAHEDFASIEANGCVNANVHKPPPWYR